MEVGERSSPVQQVESTQGSGPFINRKDNNDQCLAKSDEKPSQEKIFQDIGKEIWENMSQGYNSCVFAFGQTGSGKSFSLLEIQEQSSLVSFFCSELFNSQQDAFKRLRVSVSFVELCDEEMRDLLAPNGVQRAIKQSECDPSGPYAEGLSHHIVGSYETIKQMLIAGNKCRAMAANAKSTIDGKASQPWAIFTLTIRYTNGSGATSELCRKVSFVDSGVSEGHEHLNLDSFMGINLSESSREITDNGVDQRDSLLSWLLNQFLGGKSKATIVAMIDPSAGNYQEILTALTSSVGAKPIVIQPLRPEDSENIITDSLQSKLGNEQEKSNLSENDYKQLSNQTPKSRESVDPDSDAYPNCNQLSAGQNIVGTTTNRNPPNNHTAEGDASNFQKPRENVKVFYWDESPDVTFLESRLKERFPMISKGMSLIPLCDMAEDKWKSEARKAKIIIFCYSMQSRKHIEDEAAYLQFCIGMNGPTVIVMVTELEDSASRDEQSREWERGPYKEFHLLSITKEEMKIFKSRDKGPRNCEKQESVPETESVTRHHNIGIFSRSAESDYQWLLTILKSEFRDLVDEVRPCYISNSGDKKEFSEQVSQCTFAILYHSMNRGRSNITDNPYDDLKLMPDILGKANVIVVAEGMEDSFPTEHSIGEYACDLVIITQTDKEDNSRLMGKLNSIKQNLKKAGHQKEIAGQTQSCANGQKLSSQTNESCSASQDLKEMEKQSENAKNGQKTLIRKHHKIGIFSRSAGSDYDWLQTSLRTELRDLVVDVRACYISNNGRLQFWEEVSQCTFGILYHTMRRGRLNITNVTDSLYDEELKYMAEILGKENVIVVADDLEDSSPEEKHRILANQYYIREYACDLVLLTQEDKEDKARMMEELEKIRSALLVTSLYVQLTEKQDKENQFISQMKTQALKAKNTLKQKTANIFKMFKSDSKQTVPFPAETNVDNRAGAPCTADNHPTQEHRRHGAGTEQQRQPNERQRQSHQKGVSQGETSRTGRTCLSIKKHHKIGIFSRSAESDYDWLQTSLRTELRDLVVDVRPYYISNNGRPQFWKEVSQCTFGILYHTMRRGRLNITNVTDSLYNEELKYMAEKLGKENVFVVADDLEDSSPEEQQRILEHQPNIGEYACDLVLLTPADKKEKAQLMEKLKTIRSALHVTSLYVHLNEEEDDDDQIKNITEEITRLVNNLPKPVEKTMKEIMQRLDCDTPDFLKKYFKQAKGRTVNIVQFFKNFYLKEKGTSESKDSWELRRLNSLTDSVLELVTVQRAKKKHKVGIFSRSAEDDYRWLHRFILSEFSDYVQEVRPCYISNNGLKQLREELSQCSVAILYHTKNRGRINITDVVDSLYDEELQYLAEKLGRDRVMVVVDDLEDSSSDEKERILRSQGSIGKWASDLILISTAEKNFHASGKSNYKQLLLEKFNRFTKV